MYYIINIINSACMDENKLRKEIKVVNVVTTADLLQKINIASFNKYQFLHSNLDLYRCGYVKDNVMIGRVTVFASGKMISVGTKSPHRSFLELKKAVRIMKKYGLVTQKKIDPQVRNLVAKTDFRKSINIEKMARTIPKSMYEPEQFPGLIHRVQGSVVALIFVSGKIIIVGAKSYNELNSAHFEIFKKMELLF